MKIAIGTSNPAKIEGAKKAFDSFFEDVEVIGIKVESDVSDQPVNDEIKTGVKNRIENLKRYCRENNLSYDFYISVESGISDRLGEWFNLSMAGIEDKDGQMSYGTSAGFPIPDKYVDEIRNTNLTNVMKKLVSGQDRSKDIGGIGILTKGSITRIDLTKQAFIMALTKHINENWR